jgi:RNA polymerase sigma-70 factor (ECF subfamily)
MNDFEIIDLINNGDTNKFDFLVNKYINQIKHLVFSYLKNFADTDDVVQEIFIKTYYSLKKFKKKSSFKTYLYRIAINECNLFLNKNKKLINLSLNDEIQSKGNSDMNPDIMLENKMLSDFFDFAIKKLSAKLRNTLILKERENKSYEEISQILGVPLGTVESRIFAARKKLQKMYNKIKG